MKKRITGLIMTILLILSTGVYSQDKTLNLGIRIAPNLAWMTSDATHYDSKGVSFGGTLGFITDLFFAKRYAISTGFNFSLLSGSLEFPEVRTLASDTSKGMTTRNYNFIYFEIPLMMKMKTKDFGKFCFFAQIGVGTGFRIKAKANDEFTVPGHETISDKKVISDQTHLIREALLVGIGSEYHIDESTSIVVGINYSNSLNNLLNQKNSQFPEIDAIGLLNFAELSIGVFF